MPENKFHTIKFWNEGSSRVTTKEYVSIETIREFINQQTEIMRLTSSIGGSSVLVKLEQLLTN